MSEYVGAVVGGLRAVFEGTREPVRAVAMAAYMRDQFPFLGIPSPERAALQRQAVAGLPKPTEAELDLAVRELWALPEREYQYAALDLLLRNVTVLSPGFLETARWLATAKSWWDTVDTLAAHVVGALVLRNAELGAAMDTWAEDADFWVVRTAILHQLRFKSATDTERLFRYCEMHAGNSEFFIRKAIGWALREYSKTDAAAVRQFVAEDEGKLSGLSKREALLWLNGGRKGGARRE